MILNSINSEVLRHIFFHGPLMDGDMISKSARSELVQMGLIARMNGWQYITHAGMEFAMIVGLDKEKDAWRNKKNAESIKAQ